MKNISNENPDQIFPKKFSTNSIEIFLCIFLWWIEYKKYSQHTSPVAHNRKFDISRIKQDKTNNNIEFYSFDN